MTKKASNIEYLIILIWTLASVFAELIMFEATEQVRSFYSFILFYASVLIVASIYCLIGLMIVFIVRFLTKIFYGEEG